MCKGCRGLRYLVICPPSNKRLSLTHFPMSNSTFQSIGTKFLIPTPIIFKSFFTHIRNSLEETGTTKIEIIGQTDGEESESVTLRPNRFKPQDGVKDRLRIALHSKLDDPENSNERYFWGAQTNTFSSLLLFYFHIKMIRPHLK